MKKKYVLVGAGNRASMYINALTTDYADVGELLALCDTNQCRMDYWNTRIAANGKKSLPTYKAFDFDRMVREQKPDMVIVTSIDRTHHKYICRAMELGCDVITEKPMTIDAEKCDRILETSRRTGKKVTVTFNYRYSPRNTKVKEIIRSGLVGSITGIHFEWLLSTVHGADYFRRWHRDKNNSGGLMVHKATHHFDLVNWWIDAFPQRVFAMGGLYFYGKENAENRGITDFYYRCKDSEAARKDPFALRLSVEDQKFIDDLYLDKAEKEDQYFRDLSVFSDGISIEDNMAVMVSYDNKAVMTYSLHAHAPWEGYRVCFNGTKGRLEFNVVERSFEIGHDVGVDYPGAEPMPVDRKELIPMIVFQPHWGKAHVIPCEAASGGHGGGDVLLLDQLFRNVKDDPLGHVASELDGAKSILVGIAANQSMRTGLPVDVKSLVDLK